MKRVGHGFIRTCHGFKRAFQDQKSMSGRRDDKQPEPEHVIASKEHVIASKEHFKIRRACHGFRDVAKALDVPVFRKDDDKLVVNFSEILIETLQEAKYEWVVGKGQQVSDIFEKREILRQYRLLLLLLLTCVANRQYRSARLASQHSFPSLLPVSGLIPRWIVVYCSRVMIH